MYENIKSKLAFRTAKQQDPVTPMEAKDFNYKVDATDPTIRLRTNDLKFYRKL